MTKTTRQRAREIFLTELAQRGVVSDAVALTSFSRNFFYDWRNNDATFAAEWDAALEIAIERAEREAYRRGVEGWDEPVYGRIGKDQDGEVGIIRKYSDTMLTLVLKAHKPEKYRERMEHEHRGSIAVEFVNNWRDEADA